MSAAKATDVDRAEEIIRLARELEYIVDSRALTKSDFSVKPADHAREDAVIHVIWQIERLLEEAKELFNSQRDLLEDVDLDGLSQMRDKTVHHYEDGSEDVFWWFYDEKLPTIVDACQRYLSNF